MTSSKWCCFFSLLLMSLGLLIGRQDLAAQHTVTGVVISQQKEALEFVQVIAKQNDKVHATVTDSLGQFALQFATQDSIFIEFRLLEYKPQTQVIIPAGSTTKLTIVLAQDYITLGVVTITERFSQRAEENISSIRTLGVDRVHSLASVDVVAALSTLPGITIYDKQPSIRGSSGYTYGAGSRVLTLLNGLPMITSDRGAANWDMLPADGIRQIEVLPGAASVLYGAGALGGVINVITQTPADTPTTALRVRAGINDAPRNPDAARPQTNGYAASVHLFHASKLKSNYDFTLNTDVIRTVGYREGENNTRFRILTTNRYTSKKIQGLQFGVNLQYNYDSAGIILFWQNYPKGALQAGRGYLSGQELHYLSIDPIISYTGSTYKHTYQGRFFLQDNRISTGQSNFSAVYFHDYIIRRDFFGGKLAFSGGGNYTRTVVQSDSVYGSALGDQVALFAQAKLQITNRLTILGGARWQYEHLIGDTATTSANKGKTEQYGFVTVNEPIFRLGANYRAGLGTYLRASWGQAVRSPSVAERFTATAAGSLVVIPNPKVQIERGWSAEVGGRQLFRFGSIEGFADLALFTMRFQNMVDFYADTESLLRGSIAFKAQNLSQAVIDGLELSTGFEAKPTTRLKLFGGGGVTLINPYNPDGSKSFDGDDSTKAIAKAAIELIKSSYWGIAPPTQFPQDNPYTLRYRSRFMAKGQAGIEWRQISLQFNYSYTSAIVNVDKVFLIDLYHYELFPGVPITEELLNSLGVNLNSLFPGTKNFRSSHNTGWHLLDVVVGYTFTKPALSITVHAFNVLNTEYMTVPGLLGQQRNYAVQVRYTF